MELIASNAKPTAGETSGARAELFQITTTREREFIDITDRIEALVVRSAIGFGFVNLQVLHTTAALVINEREPLLMCDFERTLDALAPRRHRYQHDDFARREGIGSDERVNGHAHCQALLLNAAVCLNIVDGRLVLGRWQRLFLVELDGPQARTISGVIIGYPMRAARRSPRTSPTEVRFGEALGSSPSLGARR